MSRSKAPFSRPPACQPPPTSPQGRVRVGARWEELLGTTPDSGTGPAPTLVWFGHRGLDAAVLGAVADVRGIVCCDWGEELREVSKALPVVSVEKETGRRAVWSSGSLASISSDRVREAIRVAAAS
ncbi:MAG: hypothetical protein GY835_09715, partial [bacterium]|nr:hypothetical protein [bacterium]